MDTPDWTASALFSPSKARAQQAQAKDWAAVDAWLARKYAPAKRPPIFERNEDTLQALLTLATLNESADEQRALVDRVHKAALQSLKKTNAAGTTSSDDEIKLLFRDLEDEDSLDALAKTAVASNAPDVRAATIADAIVDISMHDFDAEQLLQRARYQLMALQSERKRADARLKQLKSGSFDAPEDLLEQTTVWMRNTKQLKAKVAEYDERVGVMKATDKPKITLEDVTQRQKALQMQKYRLEELEAQLSAFQSLPSDGKAAKAQLEAARKELRSLVEQRDALFANMAGG